MFSTIEKEERKEVDIQPTKITDLHVLQYLWVVLNKFRSRNEHDTLQCILCQEKLIHISIIITDKQPTALLPFTISEQVTAFVQKINQMAMESIKDEQSEGNTRLIAKAVDAVMLPGLQKHFPSDKPQILGKLKILTFNNLGCILKRNRHLMMALRAVSFAVELQEQLVKECKDQQKYDIVPTYLNKAAVLSDMGKHDRSLQQIRRARGYVQKIEKSVSQALHDCTDANLKHRLEQKKHYGQYMKMLISYNTGVQKEHQKLLSSAVAHYQQGKRLAIAIDNQLMARRLQDIILKIKKQS